MFRKPLILDAYCKCGYTDESFLHCIKPCCVYGYSSNDIPRYLLFARE